MSCSPAILTEIFCILNKLFYAVKVPFYYNLAEMVLDMILVIFMTGDYIADSHMILLSVIYSITFTVWIELSVKSTDFRLPQHVL